MNAKILPAVIPAGWPVYRIVRFYHPSKDRLPRTIKSGLTLAEAQAHCKRPDTHQAGEYFDGYDLARGFKKASTD